MIRKTSIAVAAGALALSLTAVWASDDPIATRQAMMKNVGASIGVMGKMAKGEMEFDATQANLAMRAINNAAIGFVYLFPEGSETGGETEAAPKIWEDMAGFIAKSRDMESVTAEAIAAPAGSLDDLKAQLGKLGATCQACHEGFRIKKS